LEERRLVQLERSSPVEEEEEEWPDPVRKRPEQKLPELVKESSACAALFPVVVSRNVSLPKP
jgi:hypothetical protein